MIDRGLRLKKNRWVIALLNSLVLLLSAVFLKVCDVVNCSEDCVAPISLAISEENRCDASKELISSSTEQSLTLGEVVVNQEGDVIISLLQPIHYGTYEVHLFPFYQVAKNQIQMKGYIKKSTLPNHHQCKSVIHGRPVCDSRRKQKNMIVCNFDVCCPLGTAFGKERSIPEIGETAFLSYASNDMIDEFDYSPSTSTKLKQHFCIFCKKLKTCIWRHWTLAHSEEPRVKQILDMSPIAKRKAKTNLRREGDNIYNSTARLNQRITCRMPILALISENITCPHCKGLFARKNFSRHERVCVNRPPDRRKRIHHFEEINVNNCSISDQLLQKIFTRMNNDEIAMLARQDDTIKLLALDVSQTKIKEQNLRNCRSRMRRCARLLMVMKEIDDSINCFRDCFTPDKYKKFGYAIRVVCSDGEKSLIHHNLALQYGPMLTSLSKRIEMELIKQNVSDDDLQLRLIRNFQKIYESDFKIEITRDAITATREKRKTITHMPKTEDIVKLTELLKSEGDIAYNELKTKEFSLNYWKNLSKSLLGQILIFNRRRVGEISLILLSDYLQKTNIAPEDRQHLSRLQIPLADTYEVMYIIGKRSRVLPVLLKRDIVRQMDLLIEMRPLAEIEPENKFLFAYPNIDGHFNASVVLREYSTKCKAESPTTLRSTKLRQQIATVSQIKA